MTCAEMTVELCKAIATHASSFHHLSTIPKLVDALLLQYWAKGMSSPRAAASAAQLLQHSLHVLSTRGQSMPPTLQVLFANNVLAGMAALPASCLNILAQTNAHGYIMQSIMSLYRSAAVLPSLRNFDRKLFALALVKLLEQCCSQTSAEQAIAVALWSVVSGESSVGDVATQESRMCTTEIAFHEKRLSGKGKDDSEDDEYDEAWNDSSDDDTDSSINDVGGEFDADDEEDVESNDDDKDIRNDADFSAALSKASKLRGHSLPDEFEDNDENFLEDDDFESPIDECNTWQLLLDAIAACDSRGVVSLDPPTRQAVLEAANLTSRCHTLRTAKRTTN